jgi:hypothetical protein
MSQDPEDAALKAKPKASNESPAWPSYKLREHVNGFSTDSQRMLHDISFRGENVETKDQPQALKALRPEDARASV